MKIWNRNYLRLFFLLCGNCGLLYYWRQLSGISFPAGLLGLCVAVFTGGLWYIYFHKRSWLRAAVPMLAAGFLLLTVSRWGTLRQQAESLLGAMRGELGLEERSVTLLFLMGALLVAAFLFFMEIVLQRHLAVCALTAAMLLAGPLAGISSGTAAVFLLLLFQLSFFVIKAGGPAVILTAILFGAAGLISVLSQESLYQSAYEAEHYISNTVRWLTGMADEAIARGDISRGNDYRTGTVQLEIETNVPPDHDLYLRGFSGNRYVGSRWERANETELLSRAAELMGSRQRVNGLNVMYGGMYYTLNFCLSGTGLRNSRSVTIKHVSGHYRNYFSPYGGMWIDGSLNSTDYDYEGYIYRYYEQADMNIGWDRVTEPIRQNMEYYRSLQNAYAEAVQEFCLEVPEELLPRLVQLCAEYPLEDLDEITTFILTTLETNTSYTLTPGNAPFNKDIVEYFLFDSGKGYCQHYAATAALMYRLYGVPARYASGYVVKPEDFVSENGLYRAHVTDEASHAWVEIFVMDYGWVPVEVTPASDGNIRASYPGFDAARLEEILEQYRWDLEIVRQQPDMSEEQADITAAGEESFISLQDLRERYAELLRVAVVTLAYAAVLSPFLLYDRRQRHLQRLRVMSCRGVFYYFIKMLHFAGILPECDGTEGDFAQRLAGAFPELDGEMFSRMVEIVSAEAYGPVPAGEEERQQVHRVYDDTAVLLRGRLGGVKKWWFQYGICFF